MDLALAPAAAGSACSCSRPTERFVDVDGKAAGRERSPRIVSASGRRTSKWTATSISLSASAARLPLVLRNNGDGTWRLLRPFTAVTGVRAFVWADLDGDGDPDAALVGESGDLHVFENRQGGEFREMPLTGLYGVVALAIGDVDADGVLDLVALDRSGVIRRLSFGRPAGNSARSPTGRIASIRPRRSERTACFSPISTTTARSICWCRAAGRSRVWLRRRDEHAPAVRRRDDASCRMWASSASSISTATASSIWSACRRAAGRARRPRDEGLSLGRHASARAADGRRPADQLVRRRRRNRNPDAGC